MSIGSDRVRLSFNPSGNKTVQLIKERTAELIDLCETLKSGNSEVDRCLKTAQAQYEDAAMWAVKGATA